MLFLPSLFNVIPAKAGIHDAIGRTVPIVDPRLRGDDKRIGIMMGGDKFILNPSGATSFANDVAERVVQDSAATQATLA